MLRAEVDTSAFVADLFGIANDHTRRHRSRVRRRAWRYETDRDLGRCGRSARRRGTVEPSIETKRASSEVSLRPSCSVIRQRSRQTPRGRAGCAELAAISLGGWSRNLVARCARERIKCLVSKLGLRGCDRVQTLPLSGRAARSSVISFRMADQRLQGFSRPGRRFGPDAMARSPRRAVRSRPMRWPSTLRSCRKMNTASARNIMMVRCQTHLAFSRCCEWQDGLLRAVQSEQTARRPRFPPALARRTWGRRG